VCRALLLIFWFSLQGRGHRLGVTDGGVLDVSNAHRLRPTDRLALARWHWHVAAVTLSTDPGAGVMTTPTSRVVSPAIQTRSPAVEHIGVGGGRGREGPVAPSLLLRPLSSVLTVVIPVAVGLFFGAVVGPAVGVAVFALLLWCSLEGS